VRRIVVVGGGLAGHRAAEALRRGGFAGHLSIVGDETHRPYDRPPLSKRLLGGVHEEEHCFFPVDDLNIDWVLGSPATGLDLGAGVVRLADGTAIEFDDLVIATGRRARQWPHVEGLDGLFTLRSLDDARSLRAAVGAESRVAIIGAGFIGCEVAATLRGLGVREVTLIDIAPYPMPVLGAEAGERAARLHTRHGVRLRLGQSVEAIEGDGHVTAVTLVGGERIDADVVLVAVGAVPNSEWLIGSGIELLAGAVVCDEFCFAVGTDGSSIENVVAVGDVAAWRHPHAAGPVSIEHWTNARDMAAAAAANLLAEPGGRTPFTSVPTFWSDQYDVKIKSAGFLRAATSFTVVEEDPDKPSLVVEAHRGGELVGAIVFNKNRAIIGYQRKLIGDGAVAEVPRGQVVR
jgi:NADPH-dependent 2,4-dienoyl-CoA reductase/sulfur reductase-like enzyme